MIQTTFVIMHRDSSYIEIFVEKSVLMHHESIQTVDLLGCLEKTVQMRHDSS